MSGESAPQDPPTDLEVLRSACEESRVVLDYQLEVLAEIDEKAIWSVRTAIIVLGLLISVGSLTDGSAIRTLSPPVIGLATAGTLSLLFTIWFGLLAYHWSFEAFGIGPQERQAALSGRLDEREWLQMLLQDWYPEWIERQAMFNVYNNRILVGAHLLLSIGVTLVLSAGGLYLIGAYL